MKDDLYYICGNCDKSHKSTQVHAEGISYWLYFCNMYHCDMFWSTPACNDFKPRNDNER